MVGFERPDGRIVVVVGNRSKVVDACDDPPIWFTFKLGPVLGIEGSKVACSLSPDPTDLLIWNSRTEKGWPGWLVS